MVRFLEFMKENMRKEDLKNKIRYIVFAYNQKATRKENRSPIKVR